MKIKKILYVFILWCFIFTVPVFAKSPVWKISKQGNHIFVGGTVHFLSKSDYPLPDAFDSAYKNSTVLVLETDLQQFQTPEVQKAFMQNAVYQGEENITHFLKPDTVQALETHLTNRGIPAEQILKLKPGLLSITLTLVELQRLGQMGTGVDEFYNLKAINEKRDVNYLETVSEQLRFIAGMGEGVEDEFINYTLDDLKDLPDMLQSLKDAWRTGNNDKMQKIALDPLRDRFPEIYKILVADRNNNWISQIETMLKTREVEFVLFGALHLAGKEGILFQLEELGYTIENI